MTAPVPVTNTAVLEAVDRLVVMVKAACLTLTPPLEKVGAFVDDRWRPPYVWIYPGLADFTWEAGDYQTQTYVANIRTVLGNRETGYKGLKSEYLWTAVPTIANYLLQRLHFITVKGQAQVPGLSSDGMVIGPASPFGEFDDSGEIGLELPVTLAFARISVGQILPT